MGIMAYLRVDDIARGLFHLFALGPMCMTTSAPFHKCLSRRKLLQKRKSSSVSVDEQRGEREFI